MKELAKKFNITVAWSYGEAKHGKALVDAMSSIDCKQPIKHAIVTDDRWFKNALQQMVSYLEEYFKCDSSKEHHYIDVALLAEAHKPKLTEHRIKPCRKLHLTVVNSAGIFKKTVLYRS